MFGSIAFVALPARRGAPRRHGDARAARSVDVAAAQLIVRESGGLVAFTAFEDPLGAPLDLVSRSPVVAARTAAALAELATLPSSME